MWLRTVHSRISCLLKLFVLLILLILTTQLFLLISCLLKGIIDVSIIFLGYNFSHINHYDTFFKASRNDCTITWPINIEYIIDSILFLVHYFICYRFTSNLTLIIFLLILDQLWIIKTSQELLVFKGPDINVGVLSTYGKQLIVRTKS